MPRIVRAGSVAAVVLAAVTCASAGTKFQTTWKAPGAGPLNFAGKKVVALIVSTDRGVRYGSEDALAQQITKQGAVGVAAYTVVPDDLVKDKEKAKELLEKAGITGVVAMRVLGKDEQTTSTTGGYYAGAGYASFWGAGYWGWSWGGVYNPGYIQTETIVSVETLIYSLPQDKLVWAAMSQTKNPSDVGKFIRELVGEAAKQLRKQGLVKK